MRQNTSKKYQPKEEVRLIQDSRKSLNPDDMIWTGTDPPHVDDWSETKRMDFERKKMMKLNNYFLE